MICLAPLPGSEAVRDWFEWSAARYLWSVRALVQYRRYIGWSYYYHCPLVSFFALCVSSGRYTHPLGQARTFLDMFLSPPWTCIFSVHLSYSWFVIYDTYLTTYNDPTFCCLLSLSFGLSLLLHVVVVAFRRGAVCLPRSGCDDFFTYCINQRRLVYPLSVMLLSGYLSVRLTGWLMIGPRLLWGWGYIIMCI